VRKKALDSTDKNELHLFPKKKDTLLKDLVLKTKKKSFFCNFSSEKLH
jgi:hypothetical protein